MLEKSASTYVEEVEFFFMIVRFLMCGWYTVIINHDTEAPSGASHSSNRLPGVGNWIHSLLLSYSQRAGSLFQIYFNILNSFFSMGKLPSARRTDVHFIRKQTEDLWVRIFKEFFCGWKLKKILLLNSRHYFIKLEWQKRVIFNIIY
jgi:hypothetical protein